MAKTAKVSGTVEVYNTADITDKDVSRPLNWSFTAFDNVLRHTFELNLADGPFTVPFGDIAKVYFIYVRSSAELKITLTSTTSAAQIIYARSLTLGDDDPLAISPLLGDGYTAIVVAAINAGPPNTTGEIVIAGV